MPGGEPFEQVVSLDDLENTLDLDKSPDYALARLQQMVRREKVLGPGGGWEFYQSQPFAPEHRTTAEQSSVLDWSSKDSSVSATM